MKYDPDLHYLISGYCAETLSPSESARLLTKVKEDPSVLKEIAQLLAAERAATWNFGEHDSELFAREVLYRLQKLPSDRFLRNVIAHVFPAERKIQRWKRWAPLAAAALLTLGIGLGWLFNVPKVTPSALPPAARQNHVVVITALEHARWASGSLEPLLGSTLAPGPLKLIEGHATLAFASGATVALRAPAEFVILSGSRGRLLRGDLGAWVPPGAEGFTIETPSVEVVDLGTEFGVRVAENGVADVRVFRGLVEARATGVEATKTLFRLEQDMARRFDPVDGPSTEPAAGKGAFPVIPKLSPDDPKTSGALHLLEHAPVTLENLQSDDFMLLFAERKNVILSKPLAVSILESGIYRSKPLPENLILSTGTRVDSYLLHYDPFPRQPDVEPNGVGVKLDGTVTFPGRVLAIIAHSPHLETSDRDLGSPGTKYLHNWFRGMEMQEHDHVTLSADRRTVSVSLLVHATVGLDEIRILVESHP